ncbi:MAG TPA: alpha-galactosidase [Anaerolineaceae bacterium]|nr:alpha-galactosidase [Anaerolineaceae bacterium]HPN51975.1 alpha-galactosidase [Anaerolineaceae bacterium]
MTTQTAFQPLTCRFTGSLGLQLFQGDRKAAEARIRIFQQGNSLLEGNLTNQQIGTDHASGVYLLEGGGRIQVDILVEQIRPNAIKLQVSISNIGDTTVTFDRLTAPALMLDAREFSVRKPLWTMQGAAVHWGQDFAFPLKRGFKRDNFLGHLHNAEGGGIPLMYFWHAQGGLAFMHIETPPKDAYMPVKALVKGIETGLELRQQMTLQPGRSLDGWQAVISWHQGDFFAPLALYKELMAERGIAAPQPVPADFEPAWCSWGYEFDVRPEEVMGVLPVLNELNIHWLTLDDRWFDAYGDWNPRRETFPQGEDDLRRMNLAIHAAGSFSQIWWYPLCVEDGQGRWESHQYGFAHLYKRHPEWLVLNPDGSVARNNRHLAMICPALPEVQDHLRQLTTRFIQDWGFDGHKLDNIYTMPACHNPAHHHVRPEESTEALARAYQIIFETTRQLRPNSVTQICPCGTPLTFSLLPYTDQTVTADPVSSAQVRQRIKFYKALCGPGSAVFADHVELSDGQADFASGIGAGGVPATKFIWPDDEVVRSRLQEIWSLPEDKKALWKTWFALYNQHRLAEGEVLNLYDLAFDLPETHVIRKDGRMYYAFFAEAFNGRVELRGLEAKTYRIVDYVQDRDLGVIDGEAPWLDVTFNGALLLVALG